MPLGIPAMYYRCLASTAAAFSLSNGRPDPSVASAARGLRGAPGPGRPDPAAQVEVAGVACRPRCWRPAYGNVPWSSRLRKKRMTTALLFSTRCARGPLSEWKVAQEPSRAAAAMAGVLGDMGGHSEQAHRRDEIARVIALVGPEGEAPVAIQRPSSSSAAARSA